MKPTEQTAGSIEFVSIPDFAAIDQQTLDSTIETYRLAFAEAPYNEDFTQEEAQAALEYVLRKDGELIVGKLGDQAIALAGGYRKPDGTYYIEELAVTPSEQGNGYGRAILGVLLETDSAQNAARYEIRTTTRNDKAISLYESVGFVPEPGVEAVAARRQNGSIGLDERTYLSKPPLSEQERLNTLKRIAVAYPSGNTTAVVFDQLMGSNRKDLNARIMQTWGERNPDESEIEQCCFVTTPGNPEAIARIEMFGGEFCGNATRSVAWLITKGQDYEGLLEVSGVARPLKFNVKEGDVSVEMPLPEDGRLVQPVAEGELVQLDGIAQLVVTDPQETRTPRELLTGLLQDNRYGLADQPAVGVSYYDRISGKAEFCVWVKEVDTIFDETACGSGTCAIGVALAAKEQASTALNVVQPSGETIRTETGFSDGSVTKSYIAGNVDILYDGELRLT